MPNSPVAFKTNAMAVPEVVDQTRSLINAQFEPARKGGESERRGG